MKHWQQYSVEERLRLLDMASAAISLPRLAIEKDWWVTIVLKALSVSRYAHLMSFKGGTSLSKGWHLIERFSEDIDIAIKREERFSISSVSTSQLTKVRKSVRHYVVRELPDELDKILQGLGVFDYSVEAETVIERDGIPTEIRVDAHPSVLYVNYKSILPESSEYMMSRVKVEISCLSMVEPVEDLSISSFISEAVPDAEDFSVDFKTVVPTRTFLEKVFLLHEEFQKASPRSKRMSRHLYDLEKLMDTPFGREAVMDSKLYNDIVRHRSIFNNIPYIDYNSHAPQSISFIPHEDQIEAWRSDYNSLVTHLLYFSETKITFEQLMSRMEELQDRIRNKVSIP